MTSSIVVAVVQPAAVVAEIAAAVVVVAIAAGPGGQCRCHPWRTGRPFPRNRARCPRPPSTGSRNLQIDSDESSLVGPPSAVSVHFQCSFGAIPAP